MHPVNMQDQKAIPQYGEHWFRKGKPRTVASGSATRSRLSTYPPGFQ